MHSAESSHTTTIVLQHVHLPTTQEVESLLDSLIAAAERQGVEPLRAMAIFVKSREEQGDVKAHLEIDSSRVVNDGVMQGKWERWGS